MKQVEWKFYFPDFCEDESDAVGRQYPDHYSAEDVAQCACEYHWSERDGWEAVERPFEIRVISPDGLNHTFTGEHVPSIDHNVKQKPSET